MPTVSRAATHVSRSAGSLPSSVATAAEFQPGKRPATHAQVASYPQHQQQHQIQHQMQHQMQRQMQHQMQHQMQQYPQPQAHPQHPAMGMGGVPGGGGGGGVGFRAGGYPPHAHMGRHPMQPPPYMARTMPPHHHHPAYPPPHVPSGPPVHGPTPRGHGVGQPAQQPPTDPRLASFQQQQQQHQQQQHQQIQQQQQQQQQHHLRGPPRGVFPPPHMHYHPHHPYQHNPAVHQRQHPHQHPHLQGVDMRAGMPPTGPAHHHPHHRMPAPGFDPRTGHAHAHAPHMALPQQHQRHHPPPPRQHPYAQQPYPVSAHGADGSGGASHGGGGGGPGVSGFGGGGHPVRGAPHPSMQPHQHPHPHQEGPRGRGFEHGGAAGVWQGGAVASSGGDTSEDACTVDDADTDAAVDSEVDVVDVGGARAPPHERQVQQQQPVRQHPPHPLHGGRYEADEHATRGGSRKRSGSGGGFSSGHNNPVVVSRPPSPLSSGPSARGEDGGRVGGTHAPAHTQRPPRSPTFSSLSLRAHHQHPPATGEEGAGGDGWRDIKAHRLHDAGLDADEGGSDLDSDNNSRTNARSVDRQRRAMHVQSQLQQAAVEQPADRARYKEFFRQLRSTERASASEAYAFALASLPSLPWMTRWKAMLELADLCKRDNNVKEARHWHEAAVVLRPAEAQVWLDYAKMEEEVGEAARCGAILHAGLRHCGNNEVLLTRAVKHEERVGNLQEARRLLARLRSVGLTGERAWRTVLEGALMEARAGNQGTARNAFKFLMKHVPWYGPIFYEAFRFEERTRHDKRAVRVVQRGTREISRYGPLWFGAFRIFEKLDTQSFMAAAVRARHAGRPVFPPHQPGDWLHDTRAAVAAAVTCISKELVWKVYFKQAEMEARAAQLATAVAAPWPWAPDAPPPPDAHRAAEVAEVCLRCARAAYARSARHCQENLRWKVWLSGARMELAAGHEDVARALVARAEARVSHKSRSQVLLELVRLEEYCGNVDRAREMLALSRQTLGHQWKVFLESVLLERRAGNRRAAIKQAEQALALHTGTGRLWAVLMQLCNEDGDAAQLLVFEKALQQVPKSGEVWCEGARMCMNLYSKCFDLEAAETYLNFAIQFTPQYGDSFIELLRHVLLNECLRVLQRNPFDVDDRTTVREGDAELPLAEHLARFDTSDVEQRCINADPNYGGMWFHCKDHPSDTAVQIIRRAKILLCLDLAAAFLDEDHIPMTFGTSATVTSFCPDVQGVVLSPSLRGRLLFGSDQIIA